MRIRRRLLLVLVPIAALGAMAWFALRPAPEPVFEGQPLSIWLASYGLDPKWDAQSDRALRAIGTNAIPALLRMLREKDSPTMLKLNELARTLHLTKNERFLAKDRNRWARRGFQKLGPSAVGAVPALVQILEDRISLDSEAGAAAALAAIGPGASNAVPALMHAATNMNSQAPGLAIVAIAKIHPDPEIAVPFLINCLADSRAQIRRGAANALYFFGPAADSALQALTNAAVNDPDPAVQNFAIMALWNIDRDIARKLANDPNRPKPAGVMVTSRASIAPTVSVLSLDSGSNPRPPARMDDFGQSTNVPASGGLNWTGPGTNGLHLIK